MPEPAWIVSARKALEQALADLESQRDWIAKKGDPTAHILGRSLQATKEIESALSSLPAAGEWEVRWIDSHGHSYRHRPAYGLDCERVLVLRLPEERK